MAPITGEVSQASQMQDVSRRCHPVKGLKPQNTVKQILFNLLRVRFYAYQYFSRLLNRWGKSSERDIQGGGEGDDRLSEQIQSLTNLLTNASKDAAFLLTGSR